ncbi:type 1 glutamine amidotransferase domain-containing protein [Shewanella gaetbuli]
MFTKKILLITGGSLLAIIVLLFALSPVILKSLGVHPDYEGQSYSTPGKKALIITTSHDTLNYPGETDGKPTGVFASEMTHPYYVFLEAGMEVDVASIQGGQIPVDKASFSYPIVSKHDKEYLKDEVFQAKVANSMKIDDVDVSQYDVIFMSGGWGAAHDLAQSDVLAQLVSDAYYSEKETLIGSVCHGALGLVSAKDKDGNLLIAGRKATGVTDQQIKSLGIELTPLHPETELRKAGAIFESSTNKLTDFFATHVSVDEDQRFVTGQNQNSSLETAHKITEILSKR